MALHINGSVLRGRIFVIYLAAGFFPVVIRATLFSSSAAARAVRRSALALALSMPITRVAFSLSSRFIFGSYVDKEPFGISNTTSAPREVVGDERRATAPRPKAPRAWRRGTTFCWDGELTLIFRIEGEKAAADEAMKARMRAIFMLTAVGSMTLCWGTCSHNKK